MKTLIDWQSIRLIILLGAVVFFIFTWQSPLIAADISESETAEEKPIIAAPAEKGPIVIRADKLPAEGLVLKNRFYVGLGGLYGFPSGSGDDITLTAKRNTHVTPPLNTLCPISPSAKSGFGFNLKAGYFLSELFALEALFQYHLKYEISGDYSLRRYYINADEDITASLDGEMKGLDFSVNAKGFVSRGSIRPYGVAGFGYMRFQRNWDGEALDSVLFTSGPGAGSTYWRTQIYKDQSETLSGVLGRVGAGCDFFVTDNLGLELELAYNMGFGDVDGISFLGISLGALVAF